MLQLRDLFDDDLDSVFSYKTDIFVIIKDFWLGCSHKLIQLLLILYILVYAIIITKGYEQAELSVGTVSSRFEGFATFADDAGRARTKDETDIFYPHVNTDDFIFTTKLLETVQTRARCSQSHKPCDSSANCSSALGGSCDAGVCTELAWCPERDEAAATTTVTRVTNPNKFFVMLNSKIDFPELKEDSVYTTLDHPRPIPFPD